MQKEFINPDGVYKHPAFTRVVTVTGPMKLVFIAGQTPSDDNYQPVAIGDYRGQYLKVMENLDLALKAAGASWNDVVYKRVYMIDVDQYRKLIYDPDLPRYGDPDRPPPSTLIGVTRLSNPDFLIEMDLLAVASP
jgi:enamine deaminase RidA (YjgF/YER057c/UK114 family)